MNTHKIIAWLTGILTLALAGFSFVLSFNALTDLAQKNGVSIPPLFPFVVEFAVIIFSLNALYRSLSGDPAKVQWALIIGSSLLAGLFNVAHAEADLLSRSMAAMPSLFLLLSFESFLSLVKHSVTKQGVTDSIKQLTQDVTRLTQEKAGLAQMIDAERAKLSAILREQKEAKAVTNRASVQEMNEAKQAKAAQRQEQVLALLGEGKSQTEIAQMLQVSRGTITRDVKALNGKVQNV